MRHYTRREPAPASPQTPIAVSIQCRGCGSLIEATDVFCRHCGQRRDPCAAWFYQPAWILVLALLILGPFALVLVWKSSAMGRGMKAALAVVILIYCALCAYSICRIGALEYQQMKKLGDIMQQVGGN